MPRVYIRIEEIEPSSGQTASEEVCLDWQELKTLVGQPELLLGTLKRSADRVEARAKELASMAPAKEMCPACRGLGWKVNLEPNGPVQGCPECGGSGKILKKIT